MENVEIFKISNSHPYSTVCLRVFLGFKNPRKSTFLFYSYKLDVNDEINIQEYYINSINVVNLKFFVI